MDQARLDDILSRFSQQHLLVVGDFFLDEYLIIDRQLSEISIETGLDAYQVVDIRCSPGAAGTVVSNLRALGVGVTVLGVIGPDGRGADLKRGLEARGAHTEYLIEQAGFFTPTYTKPMVMEGGGQEREIERLDIKNRAPLPAAVEDAIIDALQELVPQVDGIIVADQVTERNCGVITDRVRAALGRLALAYPDKFFAADSRNRIGLFENLMIKPNVHEALAALHADTPQEITLEIAQSAGTKLFGRNQKPVFLTMGADGILLFTGTGCEHVPTVTVSGEIDIVGAGDSTMAGLMSALCSGATPNEAALIGNLVASITIQQIGTTGTATPAQVREQFHRSGRSA
jgi:rfaE bifunctional protein kinase chain/domain